MAALWAVLLVLGALGSGALPFHVRPFHSMEDGKHGVLELRVQVFVGEGCRVAAGEAEEMSCPLFSCCAVRGLGKVSFSPVRADCSVSRATGKLTVWGRCWKQALSQTEELMQGNCGKLNATHSVRWDADALLPQDMCRILSLTADLRGTNATSKTYIGHGCRGKEVSTVTTTVDSVLQQDADDFCPAVAMCNPSRECCPMAAPQTGCSRPVGYMRAFVGCENGRSWSSTLVYKDSGCTKYDMTSPVNMIYRAEKVFTQQCHDIVLGNVHREDYSVIVTVGPNETRYCEGVAAQQLARVVEKVVVRRKEDVGSYDPETLEVQKGEFAGMYVTAADSIVVTTAAHIPSGAHKLTLMRVGDITLQLPSTEAERFMKDVRENNYPSSAPALTVSITLLGLVILLWA